MAFIEMKDILMGRVVFKDLPQEHQKNLVTLLERINTFFDGYQWPKHLPRKVNDGYRRPQDIPKNGALMSKHFIGAAIDIDDDATGTIWKYVLANNKRLETIGLWLEHPCWTHCDGMSWMHFQIIPPKSGTRFFIPSQRPNPNPKFWNGTI